MTSPITYPPGQISQLGINRALTNQYTWISYIGVDGSIWYLSGPMAPEPGAQDGIALKKHMGLMAPFEMLDQKGARQDGATWQDAVYDVGEIMMGLEASGSAPGNIRNVMRQWLSAWDPKQTGVLSVFTPDMGEWWANVRLGKNISDMFERDYTWSGSQPLTWVAKNYDAFWYSVDSVCSFGTTFQAVAEFFGGEGNSFSLNPSNWTQLISPSGIGSYGIYNGSAYFFPANNSSIATVININKTASTTNNQNVFLQLGAANLYNLFDFVDIGAHFDLYARVNAAGTQFVRLSVGVASFTLSFINGGTTTTVANLPLLYPPQPNENWMLVAGTDFSSNQYVVQRNGFTIFDYTDAAGVAVVGSSNRNMGFGVTTNLISGNIIIPPPVQFFSAADNLVSTQSGTINLTNFGDQPAWPRYLCYGPGTFTLPNGPGGGTVNFGPLVDKQVVLVTTDPQYRSVVDISPGQQTQNLNQFQEIVQGLISFATNNNVPPLLQRFESLLGILPPQGNLYSLLSGRFTNPIPGASYGTLPTTYNLPVGITNGGPTSQIVAAITPRRRWPL